jgi:putative tryptophan/tyrosine transport system substrate-binding protein
MRRREFIWLLGGTAAWPIAARGQQPAIPVIGFMSGRWPEESAGVFEAFRQGLAKSGYVEGRDVIIEQRWAEGHYDRLPAIAAELVQRRVAVLVAVGGSVSGLAAKAASTTTPIVFSSDGDAVALGLVSSLSRPSGNVTGVNLVFGALGAKRLEQLREVIPKARSVAVLANPAYPSAAAEVEDLQAAAHTLGLKVLLAEATAESAIAPALAAVVAQGSEGLLVADDPFLQGQRNQIVALAARHALPAVYFSRDFVTAGGLMSYGGSITEGYRLVGVYAGRILKGEKPADLPVVQPTKFELVINLAAAKALGLAIPPSLLARADEVIE